MLEEGDKIRKRGVDRYLVFPLELIIDCINFHNSQINTVNHNYGIKKFSGLWYQRITFFTVDGLIDTVSDKLPHQG